MMIATNSLPLLSIVVTSRNDDPGGDLIRRMQLFVSSLLEQARRHNLDAELIIVEWNPPPGRPQLAQVLDWPDKAGPCAVRIVEVPPVVHQRFKHSDTLPLFQMIAKNVGIRRARGRFILATNMDILFSDEMVRFLASGRLRTGRMYRVDRHDVRSDVPEGAPIEEQLAFCHRNIIRIRSKDGTRTLEDGGTPAEAPKKSPIAPRQLVRQMIRRWVRRGDRPLHTNACGDFTLMASEHWLAVRGYPEFAMRAFKLDGLLCYAAHFAGARETILRDPMRIYHLEHPARADGALVAVSERDRSARGEVAKPLVLSRDQYDAWVQQMWSKRQPIIFNKNDGWGLVNESLPETVVVEGIGK